VAVSTSLSDLAYYGVESVRIAFRMGIHVDRVSHSLESRESDSSPKPWAYVVTGVSAEIVQQELDRFNMDTVSILALRGSAMISQRSSKSDIWLPGMPGSHEGVYQRGGRKFSQCNWTSFPPDKCFPPLSHFAIL
jgi:hypothetical protein